MTIAFQAEGLVKRFGATTAPVGASTPQSSSMSVSAGTKVAGGEREACEQHADSAAADLDLLTGITDLKRPEESYSHTCQLYR